jgi:hypothetical protein
VPNISFYRDEEPPSPAKPNSPHEEEIADSMEGIKSTSSPKETTGGSIHGEEGTTPESPPVARRAGKAPIEESFVEHVSPEDL